MKIAVKIFSSQNLNTLSFVFKCISSYTYLHVDIILLSLIRLIENVINKYAKHNTVIMRVSLAVHEVDQHFGFEFDRRFICHVKMARGNFEFFMSEKSLFHRVIRV